VSGLECQRLAGPLNPSHPRVVPPKPSWSNPNLHQILRKLILNEQDQNNSFSAS
jgi:hypothetical protein